MKCVSIEVPLGAQPVVFRISLELIGPSFMVSPLPNDLPAVGYNGWGLGADEHRLQVKTARALIEYSSDGNRASVTYDERM